MKKLNGQVIKREELTSENRQTMFSLMDTFYNNMTKKQFEADLEKKDFCILLKDEENNIQGFSTQKIMHIPVKDYVMHGVFSGDTIIHKDYWGNMALFIEFARFFFEFEKEYGEFYWFLICKGYKTYKLLPTFFKEFYPTYQMETPPDMKDKIDAYGRFCYPEEYDETSGVVCYRSVKDSLKEEVADITQDMLRDRHIAYFVEHNPDYIKGNDIVCLTRLSKNNISKHAVQFLFGTKAGD